MSTTFSPPPSISPLTRAAALALVALATTSLSGPAFSAEFPAVIPLSSLNGTNGFRLDGVAAYDGSGYSVSSAGDINGDGFADVIVGAYGAGLTGRSYVVFGKASGFAATTNLSTLNASNGFRLDGVAAGDDSGSPVASARDVNGDGFSDLIIGAPRAGPGGLYHAGSSYVVFGKPSGFAPTIILSALNGTNGFRLDGVAADDLAGFSVAGSGDVNGDGFADVIVAAGRADPHGKDSGSSYVVFGKASGFPSTIALSSLNGTNGFRLDGPAGPADGLYGQSVAGAGDVNGDGFDDVMVGKPGLGAGTSYVVFGKASGFAATINLSTLNGANGFRLDGAAGDYAGRDVASAGDVNGDGFADMIVGTLFGARSYVVFGKSSGFAAAIDLSALDGMTGFRTICADCGAVAGGDVNGDGFADVIVGAPGSSPGGRTYAGSSYVLFGKAGGFTVVIDSTAFDGTNGFRLDGAAAYDGSGISVASAGDVNGDGFTDVIIGAVGADPHGIGSGSSYVVFGRPPNTARTRVGAAADQYISGGAFGDTLRGLGGGDALEGRGGADSLVGGAQLDAASYAHAPAGVTADLTTPANNTGHALGDSYTTVENLGGSRFTDALRGNASTNVLTGGGSGDTLTGRAGPDLFKYVRLDDSPPGSAARDQITDFNAGTAGTFVDRIDLSAIDAKTGPGNQAFTFGAFNGTKGRLRARLAGATTLVEGDVNGDNAADFQIALLNFTNLADLTKIDFIK